ncbi:protein of unknown function [Noviherbaspirillum humi]|uniref:DUF1840 domain-containing protein n=1 Tax=Noviherbaspirillum humi TaxID=1688639 RepID=A0A239I0J9_9BURK|nr:DUF1840 domain-containing protein [Noviherbaspirillum humi]SNS87336.1 protein of unknown function [Noviherbaspirillum humi]
MLVNFHSSAGADVVMLEQHAQQVLSLLGKETRSGMLTSQELKEAIPRLQQHVDDSKDHGITSAVVRDVVTGGAVSHYHDAGDTVSFASRAFPLLELMRAARQAGADVEWSLAQA